MLKRGLALVLCLLLPLTALAEGMTPAATGPAAYAVWDGWTRLEGNETTDYYCRDAGDLLAGYLSVTVSDASAWSGAIAEAGAEAFLLDVARAMAAELTDGKVTPEAEAADGGPAVRFTCPFMHTDATAACLVFLAGDSVCAVIYLERGLTPEQAAEKLAQTGAAAAR
ncbi:MAG: hypothetical protein IKP10_04045 [Clostridia bacterium]|nr:hypothetical protein [Clostridia bacterium]